jgi:hypothetical protein
LAHRSALLFPKPGEEVIIGLIGAHLRILLLHCKPPILIARHKEARETLERLLNEETLETDLLLFLREWKPSGPAN